MGKGWGLVTKDNLWIEKRDMWSTGKWKGEWIR